MRQDERIEQDPHELLASVQAVIAEACQHHPGRPTSMGLATQRSTVVAWDRETGTPLTPAISWQDRRGAKWLADHSPPAEELAARTGLRASPHYGVAKLHWWLENDAAVRRAAADGRLIMGPLAAFLVARLVPTRAPVVDTTNAARTLLLNIDSGDWDETLLARFGIQRHWLPTVKPVRADYGLLEPWDIPLTAVSGDQTAALFVDGPPRTGDVLVNLGSGAFVVAVTGRDRRQVPELLAGQAARLHDGPLFYAEGTVNGAGTALDWLGTQEHREIAPPTIESALAEPCETPIFLNAVGGLGSPWWRTMPSRFVGETATGRKRLNAHIAAVVESIAFLVAENIERLRAFGLQLETLIFTGGLSRLDRLCQIITDLARLPATRLSTPEATARGTAWLAAKDHASWIPTPRQDFTPTPNPGLQERRQRFRTLLHENLDRSPSNR